MKEIKEKYKELVEVVNGRNRYPVPFKKLVVQYIMDTGKSGSSVGRSIDVIPQTVNEWIREFRSEIAENKVGYLHGSRPRMDVATQCKAVEEHLDGHRTLQSLGEEYHVSPQTINNWVKKYKDKYKYYIKTLEPGVVQIKEESKLIYGSENISAMVKFKENQIAELELLADMMHKHGIHKLALDQVKKRKLYAEDEIETLERALQILEVA